MLQFFVLTKAQLKKILRFLFLIISILAISILITTEIINLQPDSVQQTIEEKFNQIKNQLEFKGIDSSVKDLTEDYTKLFDGYSNIIITDDKENILYKANEGYITDKNSFHVLVDPWEVNGYGSSIAYLIDGNNNVKYSAQLDIAQNMSNLKQISAENPLAEMLYTKTQEAYDSFGDKQITNKDGTTYIISAEANNIMNYEYIASKSFNLYSIYDSEHQYNNYFIFTNSINSIRHWFIIAVLIALGFFWLLLPLWVYKDTRSYSLNTLLWTLIVFVLNLPGFGIYMLLRPRYTKCTYCKKTLENDWIVCPYCGGIVHNHPHAKND
jgi:hypothetical protein